MQPRPCPVCGAEPEIDLGSGVAAFLSCPTVELTKGGVKIGHSLSVTAATLEDAVRAWNALAPHPRLEVFDTGPDGSETARQGSTDGARGQGASVSDQGVAVRFGPDGPDGPSFATFRVRARGDGE